MRKAFVETLVGLAAADERIVLLTADLGYNALEPFAQRFPKRFFNVGIAEQNMIAVATGLAEAGLIPYCYTIASFAVLRPYEFIRNGPIAHRLRVRIVGMGGGFDYATNGLTHYAIEDLGMLRLQPGIAVFAPADSAQTRTILRRTAGIEGPAYYRLGKDDAISVPGLAGKFAEGRVELIERGEEILFVGIGGICAETVAAAQDLKERGLSVGVAVLSSLNPLDRAHLAHLLRGYRNVISVEAHYRCGALGSLLAELIAEESLPVRLLRKGVAETPDGITGRLPFLQARHGISRAQLVHAALEIADANAAARALPVG